MADLLVEFALGDQVYAAPAGEVREVLQLVALQPVPGAPAHVRGAFNLRGTSATVADMRMFLGLPAIDRADTPILVLSRGKRVYGLIADQVLGVESLQGGSLEAWPTRPASAAWVTGVVPRGRDFTFVVDVPALLTVLGLEAK